MRFEVRYPLQDVALSATFPPAFEWKLEQLLGRVQAGGGRGPSARPRQPDHPHEEPRPRPPRPHARRRLRPRRRPGPSHADLADPRGGDRRRGEVPGQRAGMCSYMLK